MNTSRHIPSLAETPVVGVVPQREDMELVSPRNPLDRVREEAATTFDGSIEFAREIKKTNV